MTSQYKESACNVGDLSLIPGSTRYPGDGNSNPLQYSCLENPMNREAWWAIVNGVSTVGHDLVTKPQPWLPRWPSGRESTCNAEDLGVIPGSGRFPGGGHGNPLQYSCLENPMNREAWWAIVHGIAKSRTQLSD